MTPTSDTRANVQEEESTLRIGQLAKLASVNVETLRYYEREGLLEKPYQHLSGYRAYPVSAVVHVRSIKRAQALGFSLSEIRGLLKGARGQRFSDQASRKLAEIDGMMVELQKARADLLRLLESGCDGVVGCACGQADCPTRAQQAIPMNLPVGDGKPGSAKRPGLLAGAALTAGCAACCAPLVGAALAALGMPALAATEGLEVGLGATAFAAAGIGLNRLRRRSRARAGMSG